VFKFIGAIVGYFFLGRHFFGIIIGFVVGSVIDTYLTVQAKIKKGAKPEDIFEYYREHSVSQGRDDFATMLVVLSAAVMRADGKVLKSELQYLKNFFAQQFGPNFTQEHLNTLKHFLDNGNVPLDQVCSDIRARTQVEIRIQLLHFLFGLAKADGHVADQEIHVIRSISHLLGIPNADFESVKNMFYRNVNSDYAVLGIEATATEEEIKKAYRQMAVRYHPDKVASMGEEYQKGAKEKFQKIQEAYENIKRSRGIS
jgi:DnaJ like chaperone protein